MFINPNFAPQIILPRRLVYQSKIGVSGHLFSEHVLMHLSQTSLSLAVHGLTVDIVTIDITLQQQHRHVARRA